VVKPPRRFRKGFESIGRWWGLLVGGSRQPATERDRVSSFIDFLEDRRVLYTPYFMEYPAHVVDSVRQIETAASTALAAISPASKASAPLRMVRRACGVFLDRPEITHARNSGAAIPGCILYFAVVALRETLATEVAALAADFALDLPPELALISCRADQNEVTRRSE
jgi:hypothetical protein